VAPYAIPNTQHDLVIHDTGLRVGYWRAVSHNMLNAFANESFMDELAKAAGQDPYAYRMALLKDKPRFANVLKMAADKAGWSKPPPAGRARGIALMEGYDTYMAQVAEVSLDKDGAVRVHRVTVAADVGQMVNPDTVEAQIMSAVIFGMGAGLKQEITLDKGVVQQTNFHNYPKWCACTRRRSSTSCWSRAPRSPAASASRPPPWWCPPSPTAWRRSPASGCASCRSRRKPSAPPPPDGPRRSGPAPDRCPFPRNASRPARKTRARGRVAVASRGCPGLGATFAPSRVAGKHRQWPR
jgi:hypothetical protein